MARNSRLAWFPFYVDDFIGGTQGFSPSDVFAYVSLLVSQWSSKDLAAVPADPGELRLLCRGESPSRKVLRKFDAVIGPDGEPYLRNTRLYREWLRARGITDRAVAGGLGRAKQQQNASETGAKDDRKRVQPQPHPQPQTDRTEGKPSGPPNPLIQGRREAMEKEGYRLVRDISAIDQSRDATEILLEAARWETKDGQSRTKVRLETMSDDHLIRTVHDLRSILEDVGRKRGTQAAPSIQQ